MNNHSDLPIKTRFAAAVGHMYPLLSGCGTIANSKLFRRFDPSNPMDTTVAVTGGRARVPTHDYVGRSMVYMGDLDRKISRIIDLTVSPGDITLDIGANLGLVSIRLAHRVGSNGMVHAFEPNPALRAYLSQTIALNPRLNIVHHTFALGAEAAELSLRVPKGNAGAATLVSSDASIAEHTVQVPVRTLVEFVETEGIERIDFAKVDVEGFEAQVFIGAENLNADKLPRIIVFEENNNDKNDQFPESIRRIMGFGYDVFAIKKSALRLKFVGVNESGFRNAHDYLAISPKIDRNKRAEIGL